MALKDMCTLLRSLSVKVETLSLSDTRRFSRRFSGPEGYEKPFGESFSAFSDTIKSIQCNVSEDSNTISLSMDRVFTQQELFSGRVSPNMQTFVWALGYHALGCQYPVGLENEFFVKRKTDSILFLWRAFRTTMPPVRSLQGMCYQAVQSSDDSDFLDTLRDNPTFSDKEGDDLIKHSLTKGHADELVEEKLFVSIPVDTEDLMSYTFSTCLALLDDTVPIAHDNVLHGLLHAVLFHCNKLHTVNNKLASLFQRCILDVGENSQNIFAQTYRCIQFIGFHFKVPVECDYNRLLVTDIERELNEMKNNCLRECKCRKCQELHGVRLACIHFVFSAINDFKGINAL